MQTRVIVLAAAALAALSACGGSSSSTTGGTITPPTSNTVNLTATLTPSAEPSVNGSPTGTGTFNATLDTVTNAFKYNLQFSGLTGNATLGHIHGPFTPGTVGTAGVILNFDPAVTAGATFTGLNTASAGSATGSLTLNAQLSLTSTINGDSLKKLLLAGFTYANIHTATNPGGEIRGQITVVR